MPNTTLPSVSRLFEPEFHSSLSIPAVQAVIAGIDYALSSFADSNDAFVELPPTRFFGAAGYGRDANMVSNMLRPGFAVLSARQGSCVVSAGSDFARLLTKAARSFSGGAKVDNAEVFDRVDLGMLRAVATADAAASPNESRPPRCARP